MSDPTLPDGQWRVVRDNEPDELDEFSVVGPVGQIYDGYTTFAIAHMAALAKANEELTQLRRAVEVLAADFVRLFREQVRPFGKPEEWASREVIDNPIAAKAVQEASK